MIRKIVSSLAISLLVVVSAFANTCEKSCKELCATDRGENIVQHVTEQAELDTLATEINIARITLTMYKDRDKSCPQAWKKTLETIANCVRSAMHADNDGSINWIDQLTQDINKLLKEAHRFDGVETGVHGELIIAFGDGQMMDSGCCGANCTCADRYAGNCPCGLDDVQKSKDIVRISCQDEKKRILGARKDK